MTDFDIFQVDAFTDIPFTGNPAMVCITPTEQPEKWMQAVAQEMNLSETAFLVKHDRGFKLRWFTPETEVELCGHATLSSAHILWESKLVKYNEIIRFDTCSGPVTARKDGEWIKIYFPTKDLNPIESFPEIQEVLNTNIECLKCNNGNYIAELESEQDLRNLKPNLSRLKELQATSLIVTSISENQEFDFLLRVFAPKQGIPEDPVTGSAHCYLIPFWRKRLGKDEFTAYQASHRGGISKVKYIDSSLEISGKAVTIIRGHLVNTSSLIR